MGSANPENEAVVISNGDEIYVWRPEENASTERVFGRNQIVEKLKSFLQPISPSFNYFDTSIEGYLPDQEDSLWVNPQGAAMYVPRGKVGKLNTEIPARIKSERDEFETYVEFKYGLTRPETVNTIICSEREEKGKARLVEDKVTLNLYGEMIESTTKAEENPLLTENF